MSIKVYQDGDKFVRLTDESPRRFKGVLFTAYEGDTPKTVVETLKTVQQLEGLEQIDLNTLSSEWKVALQIPQQAESKITAQPPAPADSQAEGVFHILVNPHLMDISVPFFMSMAILSVLIMGVNGPFLALCIGTSLYAVLYHCCAMYLVKQGGE